MGNSYHDQAPAYILAGALAHLAQHMENGCIRSAHLAAMLLDQIVLDARTNSHLRQHAQQLSEILEREPAHWLAPQIGPAVRSTARFRQSLASEVA